jgi:hypothetical protein
MFDWDEGNIDKNRAHEVQDIVYSFEEIREFASEDEEQAWWATHDLAEEMGTDVTEEHHALIRRLKAKYRYVPCHALEAEATPTTTP